jgi:hypothetical protein
MDEIRLLQGVLPKAGGGSNPDCLKRLLLMRQHTAGRRPGIALKFTVSFFRVS